MKNTGRFFAHITLLVCVAMLTSCGGGSSTPGDSAMTPSGNTSAGGDTGGNTGGNPATGGGTSNFVILPSNDDEPNSNAPDVVVDANGVYHSAYADIEGRTFYSVCQTACETTSNWTAVELFQLDINSLTGAIAPKVLVDANQQAHVAYAVDFGGFGIFSDAGIYYGTCSAGCTNDNNWSTGRAFTLGQTLDERESKQHEWFTLTPEGQPRFAILGKEQGLFSDTRLALYGCEQNCHQAENWFVQSIAPFSLASDTAAAIQFDSTGSAHVLAKQTIIGSSDSTLLYYRCNNACSTMSPDWADPVELSTITTELSADRPVSFEVTDTNELVIAVYAGGDPLEILLLTCESSCTASSSWTQKNILPDLPLPGDVTTISTAIGLRTENNVIEVALIGKERASSVPNLVMKLSCSGLCTDNNWQYQELVDTTPLDLGDEGICLFLGTQARGPISVMSNAVGYELYPHWGCSTSPVEIIDSEGNRYIDYNADIRFLELAAFSKHN